MVGNIFVSVMIQIAPQMGGRAVHLHFFVQRLADPFASAFIEQAQFRVRIPAAMPNPIAEIIGAARHEIADNTGRRGQDLLNFGGEFIGDDFVGVNVQNPIVRGARRRDIFLLDVAAPCDLIDLCGIFAANFNRAIRAERIHHDDFIRPFHAL